MKKNPADGDVASEASEPEAPTTSEPSEPAAPSGDTEGGNGEEKQW